MAAPRSLAGVRILDFSRVLAGPYCTMILGDMGAEVIKVERPGPGDDLRHWGPPFMPDGESTYFLGVNRNKRSIVLDLKTEAGRNVARRLACKSDVVVENFLPGVMESFGLGYEGLAALHPGLVYCSITGYGTVGPLRDRPGYDVIIQAMGGLMSVTGEPDGTPMRVGVAIVDIATGLYAAIGIQGALQSRGRTGRGQRVDLSLLEAGLACLPNLTSGYLLRGEKPERLGNGHPNAVPYNVFPTRDGMLTLAVGNDGQWQRFCRAVGRPEFAADPNYATNANRIARRAEVEALVAGWLQQRTTDEWMERLVPEEVPCGPIYTVDRILAHEQVQALQIVQALDHPTSGRLRLVGPPIHFSADETAPRLPPPRLGEHTAEVLGAILGLGQPELQQLAGQGAFGGKGLEQPAG